MRWPRFRRRPRRTIPGSGDFTQDIDKFLPGNRITLLHEGGETYRAMWKAMDLARRTIHLETYILMSDQSGREFGRRLMAKAREGVSVRVIFDSFGSLSADPSYLMQLRNAGVRMLEYHPVAPWRPRWAWGMSIVHRLYDLLGDLLCHFLDPLPSGSSVGPGFPFDLYLYRRHPSVICILASSPAFVLSWHQFSPFLTLAP